MRPLIFIVPFVLISCSPDLHVYHDFDKSISIQTLTTYNWLPAQQIESRNNPILINELNDKRIKSAVELQLKEKGYVKSEVIPTLIVHYHIIVENKTNVRPDPLGYRYGQYWIDKEFDSYRYNEGTLIIDFMDSRNCELLWRGWAVSILDEDEISEELINKAVMEIFKDFPMSAAKEVMLP